MEVFLSFSCNEMCSHEVPLSLFKKFPTLTYVSTCKIPALLYTWPGLFKRWIIAI